MEIHIEDLRNLSNDQVYSLLDKMNEEEIKRLLKETRIVMRNSVYEKRLSEAFKAGADKIESDKENIKFATRCFTSIKIVGMEKGFDIDKMDKEVKEEIKKERKEGRKK